MDLLIHAVITEQETNGIKSRIINISTDFILNKL